MTLKEALSLWPRPESLILLTDITGLTATEIYLQSGRVLTDAEAARYLAFIERRKNNEALQYILGKWDFMGLTFKTDLRALIPRQDTEILAEAAANYIQNIAPKTQAVGGQNAALAVLDLCTGGGCLAVALAKYANANMTAADISADALSLAKENAVMHGVADKICFIECDLFNGLPPGSVFDVIVSNPPYVPTGDIAGLQAEIREWEPRLALDGGADGLAVYRRLIPDSMQYLRPGGALFLEVGPCDGVVSLMRQAGFLDIQTLKDYAGLDRVVWGVVP